MSTIAETLRSITTELLDVGIPSDEAKVEARIILQHVVGLSPTQVLAAFDDPFPDCETSNLNNTLERRLNREPLAYILGAKDFYNRTFRVTRDVLVPRPETEHLIDHTVEFAHQHDFQNPTICDIGTGSGIIAITLAKELPSAQITATDISVDALKLAKANAQTHNVKIEFISQDATQSIPSNIFDIIVSNPPYITTQNLEALQPEVRDWEPRLALDGGPDGMSVISPLIHALPNLLSGNSPSAAFIEIDPLIVDTCLSETRRSLPDAHAQILRDYAGLERIMAIIID